MSPKSSKNSDFGLGKGLDALLTGAEPESQEAGPLLLPIYKVQPNQEQPRKHFDEESLQALSDSIRENGILQPIAVRRLETGYYQIIAGERRWRAARMAGLAEIPVVVIEADDQKAAEFSLIENLQREDLNPVEEALGYDKLVRDFGLSQDEVAARVSKSRPAVTNSLRLLSLPDDILTLLADGKISAGHARALLSVSTDANRRLLCERIQTHGLSVRQAEAEAKRLNAARAKRKNKNSLRSIYIRDAEKKLTGALGRRVRIEPGVKKGTIELEYYGAQDLDDLLLRLSELGGGSRSRSGK